MTQEPATKTATLTKRQLEVLMLIAEDRENKEIAQMLRISTKTVEFHTGQIFARLGVSGRVGAVRWAIRNGHVNA